jgi:hypothetical protein
MTKREIHLADGRYVVLYTFEATERPQPAPPAPSEERPAPSEPESPKQDHE